jgi:precorrin-6B methylase 1
MANTSAVQAACQRWGMDIGFMRVISGKGSAPWLKGCGEDR